MVLNVPLHAGRRRLRSWLWHREVVDPEQHVRERRLQLGARHPGLVAIGQLRHPVRLHRLELASNHVAEGGLHCLQLDAIGIRVIEPEPLVGHKRDAARELWPVLDEHALGQEMLMRLQPGEAEEHWDLNQEHGVQLLGHHLPNAFSRQARGRARAFLDALAFAVEDARDTIAELRAGSVLVAARAGPHCCLVLLRPSALWVGWGSRWCFA
mmetsp:Transcript_24868/g.69585  ORF Transcript_24868/g.69585 Transcript_24868/m.69585 type:complete len:211 (+) Transcript_24868:1563-2195(+)